MSKKSGFTLVELLVAMAIIGVLIALAIYGVSAAQRAQRDTARKSTASDISVGIQDYYDRNGNYPTIAYFNKTSGYLFLYSGTSGTCSAVANADKDCILVPLKGNTAPGADVAAANFDGTLQYFGTKVTATESRYCLKLEDDGYTLAAKLENETWIQLGSTATPTTCS